MAGLDLYPEFLSSVWKAFYAKPRSNCEDPRKALKEYCKRYFNKEVCFEEWKCKEDGAIKTGLYIGDYLMSTIRSRNVMHVRESLSKRTIDVLNFELIKKWTAEAELEAEFKAKEDREGCCNWEFCKYCMEIKKNIKKRPWCWCQ